LLTIILALALLASACQASTASEQNVDQSRLDQVRAAGEVRIGVRNDNPPLSYVDSEGEWVGFDVDLAKAMADRMGLEPELVVVDETTRISFLQEGKIDLAVASMNHTRARDEAVDFSLTYFWDRQTFLVRAGEISSLNELFGRTVAMNAGSSAIPGWEEHVAAHGGESSEIVEFSDKQAAMQALRDGAVDGYAEDGITLAAFAAGDDRLRLLSEGFNPVQFGFGVPEGDSNWRDAINYALQDLWVDGTYHRLYDRWFGPEAQVPFPLGGEMEIWP
jgi:polar amino acid transport system substrate-binding protein